MHLVNVRSNVPYFMSYFMCCVLAVDNFVCKDGTQEAHVVILFLLEKLVHAH